MRVAVMMRILMIEFFIWILWIIDLSFVPDKVWPRVISWDVEEIEFVMSSELEESFFDVFRSRLERAGLLEFLPEVCEVIFFDPCPVYGRWSEEKDEKETIGMDLGWSFLLLPMSEEDSFFCDFILCKFSPHFVVNSVKWIRDPWISVRIRASSCDHTFYF